jgi:hypothetical protein
MVRLTMLMLCFLLAAAAAGRYQAEVSVREARREIQELDRAKAKELSQIQVLRAEVAYLESPDRLAKIASRITDLEPLSGRQLLTADEFLIAIGDRGAVAPPPVGMPDDDPIKKAIAVAELNLAE